MAKPIGHDDWASIEDVVVNGIQCAWTGYLKVKGGWIVKSACHERHAMSITFVPDPNHDNPPEYVRPE